MQQEALKSKQQRTLSYPEIAAMKAYALTFRGTYKDYIDLYFILKEKHTDLLEIKDLGEKRYKEEFNFRLFLEQLVYLQDVEIRDIDFLKKSVSMNEMKKFFEQEISKIKL